LINDEKSKIVNRKSLFLNQLSLKNILITAGPTQEPIDPVRYLSNHSSGKMGYALARAAKRRGHRVCLISGPTSLTPPKGVRLISVNTAQEMYLQTLRQAKNSDAIFMVAAVADYRPVQTAKQKIKKTGKRMTLKLIRNPDILETLGKRKRKNQILVGFAAETQRGLQNAKAKLKKKNCDWMILNDVSQKDIGFGSDKNKVTLISKEGRIYYWKKMSKDRLSVRIITKILNQDVFS